MAASPVWSGPCSAIGVSVVGRGRPASHFASNGPPQSCGSAYSGISSTGSRFTATIVRSSNGHSKTSLRPQLVASRWSRTSSAWLGASISKTCFQQGPLYLRSLDKVRAELKPETDVKESLGTPPNGPVEFNSASENQTILLSLDESTRAPLLIGEDAGVFDVTEQKTSSWIYFTLVLGVVLAVLYGIWLDPNIGYGGAFVDALTSLNSNHEVVMLEILLVFALVHSGGAGLRATGEKLIGERAYRVLFAGLSLPLAVSAVVYFINHRYDGLQIWQVRTIPGIHEFCWIVSFISFFFLYPSTFNLLEVAAVDKPKVHMYETGIMRITRHPQMVGQLLWCIAHTLWIGNSFTLTTSVGLLVHHLFGVWHGDRRLTAKYGEAFEIVKQRTSVIPFAAIVEGRQQLPPDFYKEFLRVPYYVIVVITIGAYFSHPLMQIGSHWLHW